MDIDQNKRRNISSGKEEASKMITLALTTPTTFISKLASLATIILCFGQNVLEKNCRSPVSEEPTENFSKSSIFLVCLSRAMPISSHGAIRGRSLSRRIDNGGLYFATKPRPSQVCRIFNSRHWANHIHLLIWLAFKLTRVPVYRRVKVLLDQRFLLRRPRLVVEEI